MQVKIDIVKELRKTCKMEMGGVCLQVRMDIVKLLSTTSKWGSGRFA